jgi:hypothetical protein
VEIQDEMRMKSEDLDQGIFVVAFVEKEGRFLRGRIDELCPGSPFCHFLGIDDCDYYQVPKNNLFFYMDEEFAKRHPQVMN